MDLDEFAEKDQEETRVAELVAQVSDKNRRIDEYQADTRRLQRLLAISDERISDLEDDLQTITQIKEMDAYVPDWLDFEPEPSGPDTAVAWLTLSDLHLDEVVDIDEMDGLNKFNREIAEMRLERVVNRTIRVLETYAAGVAFDGIVVALAGDIITGVIHDELEATNEAPVPETIMHWAPIIAAALRTLADYFGQVFVPCVDGNHDRMYKKIRSKQRSTSSYAWIIYHSLTWLLSDDERITFSISKSPEQIVPVYSTRFLLTHGDQFRSQGGVGGIYPPMLKWLNRKMNVRTFDIAIIGQNLRPGSRSGPRVGAWLISMRPRSTSGWGSGTALSKVGTRSTP